LSFNVPKKTDVIIVRNTIQTSVQLKQMLKNTPTMRSQKLKQKMSEMVIDTSRISCMLLFVLIWKTLYVCNVLTLRIFFRCKLSVYNLTAHRFVDNRAYCTVWSEGTHGRCRNDIASALVAILEKNYCSNPCCVENNTVVRCLCTSEQKLSHVVCHPNQWHYCDC